jgi:DNA-binding response OmpR family regulator
VVTKQELLAKVWSYESTNTNLVEYQVSRLRRKLELHGPPLIHTVRGVGYRLD